MDTFSTSSPMCVVQIQTKDGLWKEVGRTEEKKKTLNPK